MLDTCLCGEAELWWNNQLDDVLQTRYLGTPTVDRFCTALEARFRPPPSKSLAKYNATRYSVKDCRSRRSITEYVALLEAAAKACGLGPAQDDPQKRCLVIQVWMHLDLALCKTVDEPSEDLTLDQFTKVLLQKQNNWFNQYPPHSSRPRQGLYHQPVRQYSEPRSALRYQGPQYTPGPNWQPTSVRQSPVPVSYPSRPIQSGPPNTWNSQVARPPYQPNTTYQYRSQSNWPGPNTTGQQAQSQGPTQVQDRNQDPNQTQRPPFGPTSAQNAPYSQGNCSSFY